MRKPVFWTLFALTLALGLACRVIALGPSDVRASVRPMHHDEANQAVRFGLLLETGEYRYDRNDHHGPTLYYLTLPAAWLRAQATLASLDEWTVRIVPAVFGAATILLFALLAGALGRTAIGSSALLAAVSPALTYYSRFYIQESLLAFFVLAFVIAIGRYANRPRVGPAVLAGLFAGLAYATKETSVILLPAALAACVVAAIVARLQPDERFSGLQPRGRGNLRVAAHAGAGMVVALGVAVLLFTSFLRNPAGIVESVRAFSIYARRGVDTASHAQPWYYYLRTLAWSSSEGVVFSEALVLALALVGLVAALRPSHSAPGLAHSARRSSPAFWPLYLSLFSLGTLVVFSAVRYKTPWNLLTCYIGLVLLAGIGLSALLQMARRPLVRALLVVAFAAGAVQLAAQDWRANTRYAADPRNPYAYVHTSRDFLRLVTRVRALAAVKTDGTGMFVKVIAGPYEQWPLPWYLRDMKRVGYWTTAEAARPVDNAPVIVASDAQARELDAALGDRYVAEYYGLRPNVLLTLYIKRGLWEKFLATRR